MTVQFGMTEARRLGYFGLLQLESANTAGPYGGCATAAEWQSMFGSPANLANTLRTASDLLTAWAQGEPLDFADLGPCGVTGLLARLRGFGTAAYNLAGDLIELEAADPGTLAVVPPPSSRPPETRRVWAGYGYEPPGQPPGYGS